jgi:hypothetical protein
MTDKSTDSVLEKLRGKRTRATVPERTDVLVPKSDSPTVPEQSINSLELAPNSLESLQKKLASYPETVRHSGIVLDREIDRKLTRFCKDHKVTVELFLESAWCLSELEPDLLAKILVEAKQRYLVRKEAGKTKRLLTMLKKSQ